MNTMITSPHFETLQREDPSSYLTHLKQYILPESLSPEGELNWGRLIGTWHEKKSGNQPLIHTYAFCIDGKEGGIYMDCRPGKIFVKCLVHLFARPLHTLIKTIYQISLYPIFFEIAKIYRSKQTENMTNPFKACADIILTPLYGIILTVVTVAVLISGIFASENLYEGRKLLGKIEQASNWGKQHTFWTLAKCFQPYSLEILKHYEVRKFSDTIYLEKGMQEKILLERSLSNYTRAKILFKKRCFDPFSCSKLKASSAYQSPIILEMAVEDNKVTQSFEP